MTPSGSRRALIAIFALSGASGLIYESLWTQYLKLTLGHAAFAQSLVLVIFMGGMALGAWVASRRSARLPNLLRGYALAEAAIGVYALLFHGLFTLLDGWAVEQVLPGLGSAVLAELFQWAMALLLLLPAAMLLGATFPLMSAALIRRHPGQDGQQLALLYFSNSLGAAAGALLASFVLIQALGLPGTLSLAGLVNLLVASVAWRLSRSPEPAQPPDAAVAAEPAAQDSATESAEPERQRWSRWFLAAACVTGAASFLYEVSWIRMLSLVLGSSLHAFELMLSAFITGLALGSLAVRRLIDRWPQPERAAAWIQLAMGLLAVATLPLYAASFHAMAWLVTHLPLNERGWWGFNLASHAIAFAVMLPATFMAGMTLPLFTRVLLRRGCGEAAIGRIYAANSMGAIAGVLAAVHLGLPLLGLKLTLAVGALLDIVLGLALLHQSQRLAPLAPRWRWAALAALLAPVAAVQGVVLDPAMLGGGVYRTGRAVPQLTDVPYYRDGKTASISLHEYIHSQRVISTNGKPDAALELVPGRPPTRDEVTMVLLGALPLAIKPEARSVAAIGFGAGLTTHVLLGQPSLREVHTIEIEPSVIEASRGFGSRVARAYEDPRSHIHIDDAKSWFARHGRRFDLIVSEPSNPWVSGVAGLFSSEFYARVRRHLEPGGLLVQWLHLYEFDLPLLASIVQALDGQYGDWVVYDIDGGNLMLIASPDGRVPLPGAGVFDAPLLKAELERVSVRSRDDLHLRYVAGKAQLRGLMQAFGVAPNSDYAPYVELNAPRRRFLRSRSDEVPAIAASAWPVVEMLAPAGLQWQPENLAAMPSPRRERIARALLWHDELLATPGPAGDAAQAPARDIPEDIREGRRRLRGAVGSCEALASAAARAELTALARQTLAHLDRPRLRALWLGLGRDQGGAADAAPDWVPCPLAQWPAAAAQQLALFQAVARRDAAAMQSTALALLASPATGGDDSELRRYAFGSALLAQRVLGDAAAFEATWQQHLNTLYPRGDGPVELLMLRQMR